MFLAFFQIPKETISPGPFFPGGREEGGGSIDQESQGLINIRHSPYLIFFEFMWKCF